MRRSMYFLVAAIVSTLPLTINVVLPEGMQAAAAGAQEKSASQRSQDLGDQDRLKLRQQAYASQHSDSSGNLRPDLWDVGIKNAVNAKTLGPITGVQWTQIGPAPLRIDDNDAPSHCQTLFQGLGPDSGEVVDIAIDPSGGSDQTIYIATNDGGIWKSADAGASWTPKTDFMPSLSMGAVSLDPGNSSIIYAGTGNPFDGGGVFSKGVGIYKSTNAGDTWAVLNPGSIFTNVQINRIAFPTSNTLLVATNSGLFKSVDGGAGFGANSPSFNNGLPILNGFISDLDLDTATSTTVYASVAQTGILKSTDSGSTFPTNLFSNPGSPSASTFAFIALAQSKQPNNQTMYASVNQPDINGGNGGPFNGLYKSTDGGNHWAVQSSAGAAGAADNGCQCGYDQTVGVDPQDANRVYIGFQELYLSTDGGGSFGATATDSCLGVKLTAVTARQVHWDHHALVFSPQSHWGAAPTRLYVGTDGGISASGDGGATWSNLNEGIATNLFVGIDIGRGGAANNAFTYGGCQDTGVVEHKPPFPGTDWHLGIDGDGGPAFVDPVNPMKAYSSDDGIFIVTSNGGGTWSFPGPGATGLPACAPPFASFSCAQPLGIDPNNSANVYARSGNQLYRSTDTGATFTLINTFPSQFISAFATVSTDSNRLWVGLKNGTVQFTTNALAATPTWTARTVTGAPSGQLVSGIAIDPTTTSNVVVVYPGFTGISQSNRTKHAFLTTDSGMTWNDISGTDGGFVFNNLPDLPLHSVVIDPNTTPHNIIVAGDTGVMRTIDLGKTWHALGVSLPTADCTSLAIDPSATPGLLRVGTYGRSVFELALGSCTLTCPDITQSNDPNQCGANVTFAPATTGTCGTVTCTPPSGSPFPVGTTTVTCLSAGPSCSFTVTVNDTQAPSITCPESFSTNALASCPIATSKAVSFSVSATDNCPGVTFACVPPSGSTFAVGTTTVTCTATDTSGNTATCSFDVNVFSFCLQDDSNPGNVVLVNAQTGDFIFCCGGITIASGRGTLTTRGCIGSIDHFKGDRTVHIQWDTAANNNGGAGTAYVQKSTSGKVICQITDKNMSNNTCQCGNPPMANPRNPLKERTL